jgi:hypothetical protein
MPLTLAFPPLTVKDTRVLVVEEFRSVDRNG